jgi:lipoprotein-anchoring transpeptidase ErfK/SrfK
MGLRSNSGGRFSRVSSENCVGCRRFARWGATGCPQLKLGLQKEGKAIMKRYLQLLIALPTVGWISAGTASETRVVINLSEQRAYLIEQGRVALVSPIASGKPGWPTPTGDFRIFNKDIDHRSRSFGSVLDRWGRVVNSNATPGSHVPRGGHYRPAPMPYFMEFSSAVGMHAGYLPGYPASHGCVRMPRDLAGMFFEQVHIGTRVTVLGSTHSLARFRKAMGIKPRGSSPLAQR